MGGAVGDALVPLEGRGAANFFGRAAAGGGGRRVLTVVSTSSGFCKREDESVIMTCIVGIVYRGVGPIQ